MATTSSKKKSVSITSIVDGIYAGDKFGDFEVIGKAPFGRKQLLVRCSCGNYECIRVSTLIWGDRVSCGDPTKHSGPGPKKSIPPVLTEKMKEEFPYANV